MARQDIQVRVRQVAEGALAEQHFVRPVDVLLGLGWLAPSQVDAWRKGRVQYLERAVQAKLGKASTAMAELRRWAAIQRQRAPADRGGISHALGVPGAIGAGS